MQEKENLDQFKGAYETTFKFYDENQWYLKQYSDLMCETLVQENAKSVLSLGIGHEVVSKALMNLLESNLESYHIVEGSPEIIKNFQDANSDAKIEVFHSYFDDFEPTKKYDAIEMGFVLEHVDDPLLIVNRFKHFLSDNGSMYISVPNARSLHRLIGHEAGLLNDIYQLSPQDYELGHKRYFDLDKIKEVINEEGLRVIKDRGLMLKPITGAQINTLGWNSNIIDALMKIGLDYPEISNCMYLEAKK